jgi:trans-aconitate methyltransferase
VGLLLFLFALDAQGRAMLDPIREQALKPIELIARLHLAPTATVADIGAGPGFFTLPLARAVPKGQVIAADVREDYLAVAAERAAAAGLRNVRTQTLAPDRPAFAPRSLDLAFLCQVDQYLPDRAAYFAKLVPLLARGGRVVIVNWVRFREADRAAAASAGLRIVDEWNPTPPLFVWVLTAS